MNNILFGNIWFSCWISLLARKLYSEVITYEQMKNLEENGFIEPADFTDLIRQAGEKQKDYEWYEEDFMGQQLLSETIIRVDDVMKIAEPVFRKTFGIR